MALLAFLSLTLAASAAALSAPRQVGADEKKFLSMPVIRQVRENTVLRKRDNDVPLYNVSTISYLIQLSIGTPGQSVKVAIDTGSDELWVNPQCETSDSRQQELECENNGEYDPSSSSSSNVTQVTNDIPYGKGEVQIQYVYDDISLPESSLQISQQIFGVAVASNDLNEGILGLSYGDGVNLQYPNFVDELYLQNQTNSRTFSIALGDKDYDNGGVLIFGGLDTKKYVGNLVSCRILGPQNGENLSRYWVELDGLKLNSGSTSKTYISSSSDSVAVVLDSGSSLSYLPNSIVSQLAEDLNARYDSTNQVYLVDCSAADADGSLDFSFGNATIKVPLDEFIWEAGTDICVLGALPSSDDGINILGDSMMRGGYFVFDQSSNAIHMAQYANCGQNEQEIPAGENAAASFVGECNEGDRNRLTSDNSVASVSANMWLAAIVAVFPVAFSLV